MSSKAKAHPILLVVSAPSGGGKTTLCERLVAENGDIVRSVSCTTRKPRGAEINGKHYFFLTEEEFDGKLAAGEFLENAVVHGAKYGTLRQTVAGLLKKGKSVLMIIDVQGARQVREYVRKSGAKDPIRAAFVSVFLAPPSQRELRRRLETRKEDAPEVIEKRLKNAVEEMKCAGEYDYVIVNDKLDRAYEELLATVRKEQALA